MPKLIDLLSKEPCGDGTRTRQVSQCFVCGALTNQLVVIPRHGTDFVCPNKSKKWHGLLARKIDLLRDPHPESYRREMVAEIEAILKKVNPENDLFDAPDVKQEIHFDGVRSKLCQGSGCGYYHFGDYRIEVPGYGWIEEDYSSGNTR